MLNSIILLLYLSFLIEFLIWPVPSEASTGQLLYRWKSKNIYQNLTYLFIFIFNSFFTLAPLLISIYHLVLEKSFQVIELTYIGLLLGWIGRLFSLSGAFILHKVKQKTLITKGIFKWSRNPISLGLFITFFGFTFVFPHFLMIAGYCVFVLSINHKIGIEEKFLTNKFGIAYQDYIRNTPKYLFV